VPSRFVLSKNRSKNMASTSLLFAVLSVLVFTVIAQAPASGQNKYDDRVKACYDKNKEVDKFSVCLTQVWHDLREELSKGIPEEKIPPLDPLSIKNFLMEVKGDVVDAKANFLDIIVKGGGKFEFEQLQIHKANKSLTGTLKFPVLYISGKYDMQGEILLLPINSKGLFTLNLTAVVAHVVGHLGRKSGILTLEKVDIDFTVKDIKIELVDPDNKDAIGDAVRNMLNDNSQAILEDIRPDLAKKIGDVVMNNMGTAFKSLPAEFGI